MKNHITSNTCPACDKTDMVIEILYGEPTYESFMKAEKGLLKLGGCVIVPGLPRYHCKRDELDFGEVKT